MPQWFDHAFVVLFALLSPAYSAATFRRFVVDVRTKGSSARQRAYLRTAFWLFLLTATLFLLWAASGRPWPALYVALPLNAWSVFGAILTGWAVLTLTRQTLFIRKNAAVDADLLRQFGRLESFLPHTLAELRGTWLLSLGAGVGEELLYRGFLIWYIASYSDILTAMILSSLLFGMGHAYQGAQGVLRTGLLGLGFAALTNVTGSLLFAMIIHTMIDISSFSAAYFVLKRQRGGVPLGRVVPWGPHAPPERPDDADEKGGDGSR